MIYIYMILEIVLQTIHQSLTFLLGFLQLLIKLLLCLAHKCGQNLLSLLLSLRDLLANLIDGTISLNNNTL